MIIKLTLPLPNMKLSPNRKNGLKWSSTHKHKKADKDIGYLIAKEYINKNKITISKDTNQLYEILVFLRKANKGDRDNLIASFKAMGDGIFNALELDDKLVTEMHTVITKDKENPRLEYILTDDIYLFRSIINGD
jgi:hypothetical protein